MAFIISDVQKNLHSQTMMSTEEMKKSNLAEDLQKNPQMLIGSNLTYREHFHALSCCFLSARLMTLIFSHVRKYLAQWYK